MEKNYPPIVRALRNPTVYEHVVEDIEIIETHISYILLAGEYVYKIKKPVDLGFVDFSTLEKRKTYCQEEIRLNKRAAPNLYLEVIAITGTYNSPKLEVTNGPAQEAIEYAVKMRRFPQNQQLDRLLRRQNIPVDQIEKLATDIARFHKTAPTANTTSRFIDSETILQRAMDNFLQLAVCKYELPAITKQLTDLENWTKRSFTQISPLLEQRKNGQIRECHGDMHLANLALIDNIIVPFDCLEFNERLRWIDVISDIAFLMMDLEYHGKHLLANYFLNRYLQETGDYHGLGVLLYYKVYRALVRAKVACIRLGQQPKQEKRKDILDELEKHIHLANKYVHSTPANAIVIMHGLSGSGKSYLARQLAGKSGAICLRSDLERKRLFGLSPTNKPKNQNTHDLYNISGSKKTYAQLLELSTQILAAGYNVIIDAAFLYGWQRDLFYRHELNAGVSIQIIDINTSYEVLESRILRRQSIGADPSDADIDVLRHQIKFSEPLSRSEKQYSINIDTTNPVDISALIKQTRLNLTVEN